MKCRDSVTLPPQFLFGGCSPGGLGAEVPSEVQGNALEGVWVQKKPKLFSDIVYIQILTAETTKI